MDPGWVAAVAAVLAALVVAWQSWETRRSAQASEAAVAAANEALTLSRQQAAEAVRARIDAGMPSITVFLDPEVDWPPLEPSLDPGGEPQPIASGLRADVMHMPRDRDRQLMVRARVAIMNDSSRRVRLDVRGLLEFDGVTARPSPLEINAGQRVSVWCAATHTLEEWISIYRDRENGGAGDDTVASIHYNDPADTGASDRWDLIIGGTIVAPDPAFDGGWRIIEAPRSSAGAIGAIGTGATLRYRRYYLSKSRSQELPESADYGS